MAWLLATVISLAVSIGLTPVAAAWARRIGLVDQPDGHRKLHARAIPLGGGLAVIASLMIVCGLAFLVSPAFRDGVTEHLLPLLSLVLATCLLCAIGFIDDLQGIRGRQKLLAQLVAALIVAASGTSIERLVLFDHVFEMGIFAIPVTCLWLLAVVNAVNLIDGADGLATTVCIIISVTFAVMAEMLGHPTESLIATALAGSLLGFLFYNRPPAKIFLGDAGSMAIGLLLGVLAIRSSLKGPATITLASATAIWAVLFFDVAMAIARRKLTGRSFYTVDRGHIHHVLQHRGFGPVATIAIIGGACAACAIGALFSVAWKSELWAVLTTAAVLCLIVGSRLFGHHECSLFCERLKGFAVSLVTAVSPSGKTPPKSNGSQRCTRFRGNREWDVLWQSLTEYAERFNLCRVQLNVCSPAISEEYHAVWSSHQEGIDFDCWSIEVPLFCDHLRIGSIAIVGRSARGESNFTWLSDLMDGFESFEIQLAEVIGDEKRAPVATSPRLPGSVAFAAPGGRLDG